MHASLISRFCQPYLIIPLLAKRFVWTYSTPNMEPIQTSAKQIVLCDRKHNLNGKKYSDSHLLIYYNLVQNIYNDAKSKILGKFTSKTKKRKQSPELVQLQEKFQLALKNMYFYKDNSSVQYAKICEKNLYIQNSQ